MTRLARTSVLTLAIAGCSSQPWSLLAATAVAQQAQAAGAPAPAPETYVSDSCGFPVRVDLNGKAKEILLPGDRLKVLFPSFTSTMTNLDNGESISFSSTGSFHIAFLDNGHTSITYTGRNGYDDPLEGRLLFLIGTFREEFDENFEVAAPLAGQGQIIDVCARLAG